MFKGVLNKGAVKYSLLLVLLILFVFSVSFYITPGESRGLGETGMMTGNSPSGNDPNILGFHEIVEEEPVPTPPEPEEMPPEEEEPEEDETNHFVIIYGSGAPAPSGGSGAPAPTCHPETHTICDYASDTCNVVQGPGNDECTTYDDCIHTVCDYGEEVCLISEESGEDECTTYHDCFHFICDYDLGTCEEKPLTEDGDNCFDGEIIVKEGVPDVAYVHDGNNVLWAVIESDDVYAEQQTPDEEIKYIYLEWLFGTLPVNDNLDSAKLFIEHREDSVTMLVEIWNGTEYVELCDPEESDVDTVSECDIPANLVPDNGNIKIRLEITNDGDCHEFLDWAFIEL
ncbi:MAG: hypothetical protein KAS04_03060, partial [Candidatus Aenigmarchaeota archaeon]|nr:hypothetical protein [Candidatus Aenigmarchaeota archaeon]